MVNSDSKARHFFPGQLAVVLLASAIAVPAAVAQSSTTPQDTPPTATAQQPSPSASSANTDKEGFWGHVNPFARKVWVHKRLDPIKDRLSELDEVNAKNAKDIQDVDARAQAGIHQAQSTADAANQTASAASASAQSAKYHQIKDVDVAFRGGSPVLTADAKQQLDDMAASLAGHQGYIIELEAHAPGAGSVGIQSSDRLAASVMRYLVTEHQIPVYRMHSVAMGNVQVASTVGDEDAKPARVRKGSVHIRLMENSLAAQGSAPPHDAASSTGAERP